MNTFILPIYFFILACVLAEIEVQIEGKDGWANNLPTWRPRPESFLVKVYAKVMSGKPLTGYHAAMFSFVALIFVMPYIFGYGITLANVFRSMSLFFLFVIQWDFLWFVLNPHYGIRKFRPQFIWWHKYWKWGVPVDFYKGVIISAIALVPVVFLENNFAVYIWWLKILTVFLVLTALAVVATELYHLNKN